MLSKTPGGKAWLTPLCLFFQWNVIYCQGYGSTWESSCRFLKKEQHLFKKTEYQFVVSARAQQPLMGIHTECSRVLVFNTTLSNSTTYQSVGPLNWFRQTGYNDITLAEKEWGESSDRLYVRFPAKPCAHVGLTFLFSPNHNLTLSLFARKPPKLQLSVVTPTLHRVNTPPLRRHLSPSVLTLVCDFIPFHLGRHLNLKRRSFNPHHVSGAKSLRTSFNKPLPSPLYIYVFPAGVEAQ